MSGRTASLLLCFGATMATITSAPAQSKNQLRVEFRGQNSIPADYSVQLVEINRPITVANADAAGRGELAYGSVPQGRYRARIVDGYGNVVREEIVWLDGVNPVIRLNPPTPPADTPAAGSRISARELRNPPTKKALKYFAEARKLSEKGQHEKAAEALEKAVELSPDFSDAHTNLGAQYLHLRQFEKSIEEGNRAMEIGGPNIHALVNVALAEWATGKFAQAQKHAEQALSLDRSSLSAHFVVGSLMMMNPQSLNEAIRHLEVAADNLPSAAKNLAKARELQARLQ